MIKKNLFGTFLLSVLLYYIIPLIFLKFYLQTSGEAGFILILFYMFSSFAITMITAYFIQRTIYSPLLSIVLSLPLLYVFNFSAIVLVVIIAVFSFLAHFIASILK